jgi:hypothetical protein
MPKKKSLESIRQTHGKDEEAVKFVPQTLEQVWGDDGTSKYGTMNEEEYDQFLMEASRSDLHRHAIKVGIVAIDNLSLMRDRLMKEFKKHVASFRAPPQQPKKPKKISKEVQAILDEGK